MKNIKWIFMLTIIITLIVSGCSKSQTPQHDEISSKSNNESMSGQFGGFSFGDNAGWPDYIPDDIPPIPGDITTVMASDHNVRIFFENVPKKQFKAYLNNLKKEGYNLEYVVYVQEGFPDNSKERLAKGEYDAVRIKKGEYSMTIQYGEEMGTYDIDPTLFADAIQTQPSWPEELHGILKQPVGSSIEAVMPINDNGISVQCRSDNKSFLKGYLETLIQDGFVEQKRSNDQNGDIISITLIKDSVNVYICQYNPGLIGIEVWTDNNNEQAVSNSDGLPASIPEFKNGEIQTVLKMDSNTIQIIIKAHNDTAVSDYINELLASGFAHDGDLFSNEDCIITITPMMNSDLVTLKVQTK